MLFWCAGQWMGFVFICCYSISLSLCFPPPLFHSLSLSLSLSLHLFTLSPCFSLCPSLSTTCLPVKSLARSTQVWSIHTYIYSTHTHTHTHAHTHTHTDRQFHLFCHV